MEGRRVLRSLTLRNVLSFGPEGTTLDFEPLTVLIGPNGSGKSNLFDVFELLRSLPNDLTTPILAGEKTRQWKFKGADLNSLVEIDSLWDDGSGLKSLEYRLAFDFTRDGVGIFEEDIALGGYPEPEYRFKFSPFGDSTGPTILDHDRPGSPPGSTVPVEIGGQSFKRDQSILSQQRSPKHYPFLSILSGWLADVRLYRDWALGRNAPVRSLQLLDLPDETLAEDWSNLGPVLRRIQKSGSGAWAWENLVGELRSVYDGINNLLTHEIGEYVRIEIEEESHRVIPASRLSDGTLRFLALLSIVYARSTRRSGLVCIEEPEVGLHPDVIPTVAKLLLQASRHTQVIVTTHSADLVSALGEVPEAVVVCERGVNGTTMNRLDPSRLKKWLEDYTLGHLWSMGEIGGNRW